MYTYNSTLQTEGHVIFFSHVVVTNLSCKCSEELSINLGLLSTSIVYMCVYTRAYTCVCMSVLSHFHKSFLLL